MGVLLHLLSGVALLVWGTNIVKVGILRVYGANLRHVLSTSVSNRFTAFLAGLGVTGLVQSSNATAVIVSSFVGQGLIAVAPALAIMLGANVGTALMVQVFSLDLSWLSPLLIFVGVIGHLTWKGSKPGHVGRVLIGLGLIILALELISTATRPVVQAAGVKVLFASLTGDSGLDMLVGALLTILCYSSLAVVLFCGALASAGVVSIHVGLALVLGANLGSGISALLTTSGNNQPGKRVTLGNLLSRLLGCLVALPLLSQAEEVLALIDHDPQRLIVNFHLLFNVALAVLLLGATAPLARLCEKVLPGRNTGDSQVTPRHLDPAALTTPTLALANAAREVLRIGDRVEQMLDNMLRVMRTNDAKLATATCRIDNEVDDLYTAIKLYLTRISLEALDERDGQRWTEIISLTINLEHAGDIIERILLDTKDKKIAHNLMFSEAGMEEIAEMHARLVANLRLGLSVFLNGDLKSAQALMAEKANFRELERKYAHTHLQRVAEQTAESVETSSLHLDVISELKRLNSLFCATAYPVLEQAGVLNRSRMKEDDVPPVTRVQAAQH
ncbi:Na/Pi cotransporter family protein [Cupriavidus oxalaticus]|jgi:phosphate:Na+ symporter|uniref:Transporter n=1 Tax=Cupriavidus oxalaticus TaxID=96344 RepID=A0A375G350_9BURK|nr:Na/Pi cotransporter family protein [Cupriavidus oxalaticus]QEZ45527.1 Na/Pi cotransporter family protein [Cupriavidus oxalaticus]QRQ87070.1 Na/Pi cotransporter family protein [Cupriavidus oxalaticus]QRQ94602.1 Na/Pi cotransporter family protein [Cupriavidus oxalaticus]WQD83249.1 Na/Pi cotransporter family protein [Cupriavidus oxalaticus]SPC14081.1 putative transporter [Cupriavidus oxalaticus]